MIHEQKLHNIFAEHQMAAGTSEISELLDLTGNFN